MHAELHAEIVSIGEELLSGDSEIVDTNSIYITKMLRSIGMSVHYKTTVGDNEQRITDVIKLALSRADVVITTGGLGPTVDDMTRQGIANAVGCPLEFHQELMDDLIKKFSKFSHTHMSENNRTQAYLPQGATVIDNPVGTAPGFIVEYKGKVILSVPGVPREMKFLVEQTIVPFLRDRVGTGKIIKTRVLRTAGIGESLIDEQVGDLERLSNPIVGLAAHVGQTDIRIAARADSEAEADQLIADVEAKVRQRMGEFIFGVDKEPLEDAFIAALRNAKTTANLIEIGTNNVLYQRLTSLPSGTEVITAIPQTEIDAIRAGLALTDKRDLAEALAKTIQERHPAGVTLTILSEQADTAIAVAGRTETRNRVYAYGNAEAGKPDMIGGPEWGAGWALSMAWYLIKRENTPKATDKP